MPWIACYDHLFDEIFQYEISAEMSARVTRDHADEMQDEKFESVPVMSRYRSVRHPGWAD
jgi:hypothetical protein